MKKFLFCFAVTVWSFCLMADDKTLCLSEFLKQTSSNNTFVFPVRRPMTIPAYSVVSLELKNNPERTKPLHEIPAGEIDYFSHWLNIILKKQFVNENLKKEVIALPNVLFFENKNPDGEHVFSWISDILIVRNNTLKNSYSWDTGSCFIFCLTEEENNFTEKKQIEEHIIKILSFYTNFLQIDLLPHYIFNVVKKNEIWQGEYKLPRSKSSFWMGFVEFIVGRDFTCLFFAEMQEKRNFLLRAQPGENDRF